MPFALDSQTIIIIVIAIAIIQFFVCKYVTRHIIETEIHKHNKKMTKKVVELITSTFRQYATGNVNKMENVNHAKNDVNQKNQQADSVDDPIENDNIDTTE